MRTVLITKDLRRWWSDRNAVVVTLLLPLALTAVLGVSFGGFGGGGPQIEAIPLDVVGDPPALLRDALDDALAEAGLFVVTWTDSAAARKRVTAGDARAALLVPPDALERFLDGREVVFTLWKDPGSVFQAQVVEEILKRMVLMIRAGEAAYYGAWPGDWYAAGRDDPFAELFAGDSSLEVWRRISEGGPQAEAAWERLKVIIDHQTALQDAFAAPLVDLHVEAREGDASDPRQAAASRNMFDWILPGMGIFFLMFAAVNAAADIHRERAGGTLRRLLAAPLGPADVLVSKWAYAMLNGLLQLLVLLAAGRVLFKMNLGPDPWSLPVVAAASAAMLGSLYLPLALLTRNEKQMGSLGTGLTLVLGMVGGSFVPIDNLPGALRVLGEAAPNAWAVRAITEVVARNQGLDVVLPLILRLLGAAAALLLLSLAIHRRRGGREALL